MVIGNLGIIKQDLLKLFYRFKIKEYNNIGKEEYKLFQFNYYFLYPWKLKHT